MVLTATDDGLAPIGNAIVQVITRPLLRMYYTKYKYWYETKFQENAPRKRYKRPPPAACDGFILFVSKVNI